MAMPPRPISFINWRRRRANSALRIGCASEEWRCEACGESGRTRRIRACASVGQLVVNELHADADIFDDFRVSLLLLFTRVADFNRRPADVREILEYFTHVGGELLGLHWPAGAEAIKEALTPL